jgi:proteasome assembly chaperone 2
VSLANLPQLAVDIIITSLGLTRVGVIGDGETVVPFFGPGEGSELVSGGLEGELYRSLRKAITDV